MKYKNKNFLNILSDLQNYLELENLWGFDYLTCNRSLKQESKTLTSNQYAVLKVLQANVEKCTECDLGYTRTNAVFGFGNAKASLLFIGEAPGRDEDLQGLPFVGRAGKLLTKIIESIGYKRKDVYICNILKCRPPQNRNPLPSEILACHKYLLKQINIIKPKVICALGKFAAQTLLKTDTPISMLRGRFYDYYGSKLIPTYHPAYLLRNPNDKRLVWEDMKKIKRVLENGQI